MRFTLLLAFLCGVSLLLNVECLHPGRDIATQWISEFKEAIESRDKKYIRRLVAETVKINVCGLWDREKIVNHLAELPKDAKYSIKLEKADLDEEWKIFIDMVVYINGLFNLEYEARLYVWIRKHLDGNWKLAVSKPFEEPFCKRDQTNIF